MKRNLRNDQSIPAVVPQQQSDLPRLPLQAKRPCPSVTDRRVSSAACSMPNWLARTVRH